MITTQEKLQTVAELNDLAKRVRERQEVIDLKEKRLQDLTGELVGDGTEQGRDLALAKTRLGRAIKWADWLAAHAPNVSERKAARYNRLAAEQITDVRQAMFAFLPPSEPKQKPKRVAPSEWEVVYGLFRSLIDRDWSTLSAEELELAKASAEKVVKGLGGRVEW